MRDFRNAKLMARSLCEALKAKSVSLTHSESLDVIAAIFGVDNWNILSAQIDATEKSGRSGLRCTFCRRSANEIEALVAGPGVSICNECISLCTNVLEERNLTKLLDKDRAQGSKSDPSSTLLERLQERTTDQLVAYQREAHRRLDNTRTAIQAADILLGEGPSAQLAPGAMQEFLRTKSRKDLLATKSQMESNLSRTEATLRAVDEVLKVRSQHAPN